MLVLPNAALPVLALGLAATALRRLRPGIDLRMLAVLFVLAVGLGTLARVWNGPGQLLQSSGQTTTAVIAAICSLLFNNLPAAVLFSAQPSPHPRALLLGLDLGPNLAITGSLSAFLWLQAARTVNADASIATYTKLGALLVPLTLAGALAALTLFAPHTIWSVPSRPNLSRLTADVNTQAGASVVLSKPPRYARRCAGPSPVKGSITQGEYVPKGGAVCSPM